MVKRNPNGQTVHDQEIARLAAFERSRGNTVWTNPGSQKNTSVARQGRDVYPDILIGKNGKINRIVEVETDETLTDDEAAQWALYASGPSPLTVHVPESKAVLARRLIRSHRIQATVSTY